MEIVDYSEISDDVAKKAFDRSEPCSICNSKQDLALGVVTSGKAAGRLILICFRCNWSPVDGFSKD